MLRPSRRLLITAGVTASGKLFVELGDRLAKPRDLEFEEYDLWAQGGLRAARRCVGHRAANADTDVPASQDDVVLAASDDTEWQARQEAENE